MKRLGWGILLLATGLVAFAFRWLLPSGNEFSVVDVDVQIGGGQPSDDVPPTHTAGHKSRSDSRGLAAIFDTSKERFAPRGGCIDERLIQNARVVALGAYEGAEPVPLAFVGEGDEVSRISIQGDDGGPPLVLVLGAYDPVVWDFAEFPTKRLRAVIVYGYGEQAVAHLGGSIPVRFVTNSTGLSSCGTAIYTYKASGDLRRLQQQVRAILGVPLQAFYGSYSPNALHVDGSSFKPLGPAKLRLASLKTSAPLQEGGILPGDQGLRQLLERGDIRPARPSDWAAWQRKSGQKPDTFVGDSYVILRETKLPRGMYGAHSRAFIIPVGVPQPSDLGSHNRYYRLKDGACVSCM